MTRQEANHRIGSEYFSLGTLLKTTAEIFFEYFPRILIYVAVVFLPATFVLRMISEQIDLSWLEPFLSVETLTSPDAIVAAVEQIDWISVILMLVIAMAISAVGMLVDVGFAQFTDTWLQPQKDLPGLGEFLTKALRRFPAYYFFMFLLTLVIIAGACLSLFSIASVLLAFVLMIFSLVVAEYGIDVCANRYRTGWPAFKYLWKVWKRRFWRTIFMIFVLAMIDYGVSILISFALDSVGVIGNSVIAGVIVAILNTVQGLANAFLTIGATLQFINQEQFIHEKNGTDKPENA